MERTETEKKKRALNAFLEARKEWNYWRGEVVRLAPLETRVTPNLSGLPHGGTPDGNKTEAAVEELEYAQEQEQAAEDKTRAARLAVCQIIDTAPEADQRIVLRYRYINGLTWEQIADRCEKSRQWATLVHGTALKNIFLSEQSL